MLLEKTACLLFLGGCFCLAGAAPSYMNSNSSIDLWRNSLWNVSIYRPVYPTYQSSVSTPNPNNGLSSSQNNQYGGGYYSGSNYTSYYSGSNYTSYYSGSNYGSYNSGSSYGGYNTGPNYGGYNTGGYSSGGYYGGYYGRLYPCFEGKVLSAGYYFLEKKISLRNCGNSSVSCTSINFKFPLVGGKTRVQSEYRMCSSDVSNCADVAKLYGIDADVKCEAKTCSKARCNPFSSPPSCPKPDDDDIQVTPKCTLKDLWPVVQCVRPLMQGYPYQERSACESNIEKVYKCAKPYVNCLKGKCFDIVLNIVPNVGLKYYKTVIEYAEKYDTFKSLMQGLNVDPTTLEMIINYACIVKKSKTENELIQMLSTSPYSHTALKYFKFPICDSRFLHNLIDVGIKAAKKYFKFETQSKVCSLVREVLENVIFSWKQGCSKKLLANWFQQMLKDYPGLPNAISKAINFAEKNLGDTPLPGCTGNEGPLNLNKKAMICFSGLKYKSSTNTKDETTTQYCPTDGGCGLAKSHVKDQISMDVEYRSCSTPSQEINACPIPLKALASSNCSETTCYQRMCNQPAPPTMLCPILKPEEVQITPMCKLNATLWELMELTKPVIAGFPYSNETVCRQNIDNFYENARKLTLRCYARKDCWDVFTAGITKTNIYQSITRYARYRSISTLLRALIPSMGDLNQIDSYVYGYACVKANINTEQMKQIVSSIPNKLTNPFPSSFTLGFCDNTILSDLYELAVKNAKKMTNLKHYSKMCSVFNEMMDKVYAMWKRSCDKKAAAIYLSTIMPGITRSYPDVYKTVEVAENFVKHFRFSC